MNARIQTITSSLLPRIAEFGRRSMAYAVLWRSFLRIHYAAVILLIALVWGFFSHYYIAVSETRSLPNTFYLVKRGAIPAKGDYVAFRLSEEGKKFFSRSTIHLLKRVVGTAGDVVTNDGRAIYVNGTLVSIAKERSLEGVRLTPISSVTIPSGHYYVMGLHKDSLDSRYTIVSLVGIEDIVGVGIPLL